jgi:hypothetical protein
MLTLMTKRTIDENRPKLSGVYGICLKNKAQNVPIFHDWGYFDKPKKGDTYRYNDKTYVVVGFNGIPPLGEILMFEVKED